MYLAGDIEPIQINAIGEKLALAGVQDAKLYKGIPDRQPEDWHDYLSRLREQAERRKSTVVDLPVTKREPLQNNVVPALNQMGPASAVRCCWLTMMATRRFMPTPIRFTTTTVLSGIRCRIKNCSVKWHRSTSIPRWLTHRTPLSLLWKL